MFKFNMNISDNFASFRDPVSNNYVFVESYDNSEFNVRVGSMLESSFIGTIHADSSKDLNKKLEKAFSCL